MVVLPALILLGLVLGHLYDPSSETVTNVAIGVSVPEVAGNFPHVGTGVVFSWVVAGEALGCHVGLKLEVNTVKVCCTSVTARLLR